MNRSGEDITHDHPSEERLAEFALGLLSPTEREMVSAHQEACQVCDRAVEEYREIAAALHAWQEAPPEAVAAGYEAIVQRARLHRLLDRLFANAELRRQAGQDPEGMLAAHGIAPTPQLLAAFKDLSLLSPEQFPGELDERITKFRRLLEWFPGAPGPLD
jgi:anti-sigma factor RsiW